MRAALALSAGLLAAMPGASAASEMDVKFPCADPPRLMTNSGSLHWRQEKTETPGVCKWVEDKMPTFQEGGNMIVSLSPQPTKLTIYGNTGPIMTVDMAARSIAVAEGVETTEAARQVIEAMRLHLRQVCPR